MAEKTVNYTEAQTKQVVDAYTSGVAVEAIAEMMGKSARSIVAKLSREGVYKKKEYVSKTGEKPMKKDFHADRIGEMLNLSEPDTESLTKANKSALKAVLLALEQAREAMQA
jgi:predicted DNA-binding ArsR family transcriptional regulator